MKIPRQNETRRKFDPASQRFRVRFGNARFAFMIPKNCKFFENLFHIRTNIRIFTIKTRGKAWLGKEESTSHGWYCEFSKFDIRLQRFSNPFRFQPFPSVKFITNGQFVASIRHVDNRFFDLADPIYIYLYIIKYISRRVSKQVGRDKQSAK